MDKIKSYEEINVDVLVFDHSKYCHGGHIFCRFLDKRSTYCILFNIENEITTDNEFVIKSKKCLTSWQVSKMKAVKQKDRINHL